MTELHIPEESVDAVNDVHFTLESEPCDLVVAARRIATPVVVAELRAQANAIGEHSAAWAQLYAAQLRVRAAELAEEAP